MKNKICKALLYVLSFWLYSKCYFGIYDLIIEKLLTVPFEFMTISGLICILAFVPTAAPGTIVIFRLLNRMAVRLKEIL